MASYNPIVYPFLFSSFRVTSFGKVNKMELQNISVIFGPTLMSNEQVTFLDVFCVRICLRQILFSLSYLHPNGVFPFYLLEYASLSVSRSFSHILFLSYFRDHV